MTTLASASLSRESRSIEPTWLAVMHSPFALVWVWLSHAHCTICDSDAHRSPTAKELALISQRLSPHLSTRPQHTHS